MPPYTQLISMGEELTASQTDMGEPTGEEEADQGILSVGWDLGDGDKEEKVEEKGWLEDDDIQDWD